MSFLSLGVVIRLPVVSRLLRTSSRRIQRLQMLSLVKQIHVSTRFLNQDLSDYIENSSIPTFSFQDRLPPLPVPRLEDTCRRLLDAIRPLTSEYEWKEAERLVSEFVATDGKTLQKNFQSLSPSFVDDLHLTNLELWQYRGPPPLGITYPILLHEALDGSVEQITEAAKMVRAILRFANTLKAGKLRPSVWPVGPRLEAILNQFSNSPKPVDLEGERVLPLNMEKYPRLFNAYRIPRMGKDQFRNFYDSRHIAVLRKGHIYTFDVVDINGRLASTSEIYHQLKSIAGQSTSPAQHPLAVLTSEHEDTWAKLREKLIVKNAEAVDAVETAMFVLCLDDDNSQTLSDLMNNMQCGDGTTRWYGKAVQCVTGKCGSVGILAEEVFCDGKPYYHLAVSVLYDMMQSSFTGNGNEYTGPTIGPVSLLKFDLDSELRSAVEEAKQKFLLVKKSLPFHHLIYDGFSYDKLKSNKISPDAMVQLAFQMAFYYIHGRLPSSFQPVNTAFYSGGSRIRSPTVTSESAAFVKAVIDGDPSDKDTLFHLLTSSSHRHNTAILETMLGQSFVHHIKALEFLAEQDGLNVPLFENAAYLKLFNRDLGVGTTVATDNIEFLGFFPSETTFIWYQIVTKVNCVRMGSCKESALELFSHVKKSLDIIMDIVQTRTSP